MNTMLFDFIPVVLFFIAFKLFGIYIATAVGIGATAIQVVLTYCLRRRWDKQQLVTLLVFTFFGGMTLYFHNPLFVKWKPSIIFWIFSMVFLGSHFLGKKPMVQRMLEHLLESKDHPVPVCVWKRLNLAWALFFALLGSLNIYVAYTFSTDVWVNFKVFGILGCLIIFSLVQAAYLSKFLTEE